MKRITRKELVIWGLILGLTLGICGGFLLGKWYYWDRHRVMVKLGAQVMVEVEPESTKIGLREGNLALYFLNRGHLRGYGFSYEVHPSASLFFHQVSRDLDLWTEPYVLLPGYSAWIKTFAGNVYQTEIGLNWTLYEHIWYRLYLSLFYYSQSRYHWENPRVPGSDVYALEHDGLRLTSGLRVKF